jgi:hypothetical protein
LQALFLLGCKRSQRLLRRQSDHAQPQQHTKYDSYPIQMTSRLPSVERRWTSPFIYPRVASRPRMEHSNM